MNRAEVIRQVFLWEQAGEAALRRAAQFRAMLQADAEAEYREQGTAPTWRLPDIAQVSLSISKAAPTVTDEEALAKWLSLTRPSEVELRPRPAFVTALKKAARVDGDVVVDRDGTVIPGMGVRQGGVAGSVRLVAEPEAKQVAADAAEQVLSLVAASLHLPAAPDPTETAVSDAA